MKLIRKIIKNKQGENIVCEINKVTDSKLTILILHAITGKKENKTIHFLAKHLPNSQFNTIQFDFSGHGESEGKLQDATISKQLGEIDLVLSQINEIRTDNIIIVGNSFSVLTALEFSKDISVKGAILLSGRANYLGYLDKLEKIGNNYRLIEDIFIKESFITDYKKYNPVNNILKLKKPILIFHGDKDEVVPIEEANIFLKNSQDGTLKIIKGADHRYSKQESKQEILDECIIFLKKLKSALN
ncbi:prolyl oligopeptidase family serine peptidase [archaeon]|jgi:uncharacterized protein|nr:prolyl oligopeptidase family serine peptidase [archaeon]